MATDPNNLKWASAPRAAVEDESLAHLNAFDRAAAKTAATATATAKTAADDWKNRFDRQREVIDERRRDTSAHDARVKHREANRLRWNRLDGNGAKSATGVPLTPELEKSRDAAYATIGARTNPQIAPWQDPDFAEKLEGLIILWKLRSPEGQSLYTVYEESAFNKLSLNNATQCRIKSGQVLNLQLIQDAFDDCTKRGNHLEIRQRRDEGGYIVRPRGSVAPVPPTMFPPVEWADDVAADEAERVRKAQEKAGAEAKIAQSMDFDELAELARSKYKKE